MVPNWNTVIIATLRGNNAGKSTPRINKWKNYESRNIMNRACVWINTQCKWCEKRCVIWDELHWIGYFSFYCAASDWRLWVWANVGQSKGTDSEEQMCSFAKSNPVMAHVWLAACVRSTCGSPRWSAQGQVTRVCKYDNRRKGMAVGLHSSNHPQFPHDGLPAMLVRVPA